MLQRIKQRECWEILLLIIREFEQINEFLLPLKSSENHQWFSVSLFVTSGETKLINLLIFFDIRSEIWQKFLIEQSTKHLVM